MRGGSRAVVVAALTTLACALHAAPSPAAAPACTQAAARKAIVASGFARKVKATLGASFFGSNGSVLGLYRVRRPLCADVTGDGTPEMVVLLRCCTVSSPSPWAIFMATSRGSWGLRYSRIRTVVFDLRVDAGADVEAKSPRYAPSDRNCCPSSFDYVRAHWTGTTFVTLRGRR